MPDLKILSETPVTMVQLKEELKKIKKRDEELNFRAGKAEEYLNMFVSLKPKEADELFKKLQDLQIPRLKDEHIVKVIDTLPSSVKELRVIMSGYTITISAENLKKINDVVKDYITQK